MLTHFLIAALAGFAAAISLDANSTDSICSAASTVAAGAMSYYTGNGVFASPSYWWMYGTAFASIMNYQHICGDTRYEETVYEGILANVGDNFDFQPSAYVSIIGNDDIGTWGLLAIQAAEMGFKDPSDEGLPSWLEIAENVFDLLYSRWDYSSCDGGLRWQFDSSRSGYDYKATIANANLFQLGARLAKFTGNSTYADTTESIYEWIHGAGLTNDLQYGTEVYDGFDASTNCTDTSKVLWTYNYGVMIGGCAYMHAATGDSDWETRAENIMLGSQALYNNTILYERACESFDSCNTDQTIFKAIYSRYMGAAGKVLHSVADRVKELLTPGAKAASKSCSGGSSGSSCGLTWSSSTYDGNTGLGQQVDALEIILSLIFDKGAAPLTA